MMQTIIIILLALPVVLWGLGGFKFYELIAESKKIIIWYIAVGILAIIFYEPPATNWAECILPKMRDVQNDVVARSIYSECIKQFPTTIRIIKSTSITEDECIQEYGKNVSSKFGSQRIYYACKNLYSIEKKIEKKKVKEPIKGYLDYSKCPKDRFLSLEEEWDCTVFVPKRGN